MEREALDRVVPPALPANRVIAQGPLRFFLAAALFDVPQRVAVSGRAQLDTGQ